jgi:hypothetical protein
MKRAIKAVNMNEIRIDGGTQSRVSIDPHWISEIVDNMKHDVVYPAIHCRFDGVTYWLSDGFHRYHAHIQLGLKTIQVAYLPGSVADARRDSYSANSDHGKPRSYEDKRKAVLSALADPDIKDKSNREIARICSVSHTFVNDIIKSEAKKQQKEEKPRENPDKKPAKVEALPPEKVDEVEALPPAGGEAPDDAELLANQKKHEADLEMLGKLLDADDKMAHLYEENQRLNHLVTMKDLRIKELMSEKGAAVKMVKDLQKQLDKLKAKK